MGKGSTEIQRDIEHQRRALGDRVNRLDSRVRDDVEDLRGEAQSRAQQYADLAKDQAAKVKDKAAQPLAKVKDGAASANHRLPGEDSALARHPNLLLLGSFATGFAAGIATGGGGDESGRQRQPRQEDQRPGRRQEQGGPGILGKGVDSAKAYLGTELTTLLREVADDFMGRGDGKSMEGGLPGALKSAWEKMSPRPESRPAPGATHLEMHERDLPKDRPLSDLEERSRADMKI